MIRAHELLRPGGVLSFILPNSWLTVGGYAPFRAWLLEHFEVLEIVNVWKIFADVNHDAMILIARKKGGEAAQSGASVRVRSLTRGLSEGDKLQQLAEENWDIDFATTQEFWRTQPRQRFEAIYRHDLASALDRVAQRAEPLGTKADVTVGIQVYHRSRVSRDIIRDRAFHSKIRKGAD